MRGRAAATRGNDFVGPARQNGGALSSLTRTQRRHHAWQLCERTFQPLGEAGQRRECPDPLKHRAGMARLKAEGSNGQIERTLIMARSKPSARDALLKLRAERDELATRETRLREEAATELGTVLLDCGAEVLEPAQLKQLLRVSMTLGIDTAIKRLSAA